MYVTYVDPCTLPPASPWLHTFPSVSRALFLSFRLILTKNIWCFVCAQVCDCFLARSPGPITPHQWLSINCQCHVSCWRGSWASPPHPVQICACHPKHVSSCVQPFYHGWQSPCLHRHPLSFWPLLCNGLWLLLGRECDPDGPLRARLTGLTPCTDHVWTSALCAVYCKKKLCWRWLRNVCGYREELKGKFLITSI